MRSSSKCSTRLDIDLVKNSSDNVSLETWSFCSNKLCGLVVCILFCLSYFCRINIHQLTTLMKEQVSNLFYLD